LTVVDRAISHGYPWVVDADIQGFFNNVDHEILLTAINEEVSDGSVLRLVRAILTAGVIHPGVSELDPTELGTPQGGPLSPLLANIYLHRLDRKMEGRFNLVRYADDFVIFARSQSEAEAALSFAREILEGELKLTLHPGKTRIVTVDAGFTFLGFHYFRRNEGLYIKTPSRAAMQKMRDKVKQLTPRIRNQTKPKKRSLTAARLAKNQRLDRMIRELNRYLTAWYGYFRMSSLPRSTGLDDVDARVRARLRIALTGRVGKGWWTVVLKNSLFHDTLGLVSLHHRYKTDPPRRVLAPRPAGLISMESRLR
jgi:group II intron reverse transcriptase/maturase